MEDVGEESRSIRHVESKARQGRRGRRISCRRGSESQRLALAEAGTITRYAFRVRISGLLESLTASAATRPARRTFKALSPPPCSAGPRNCSTDGRTSVRSIFWPKSCLPERRAPRPCDTRDENSREADAADASPPWVSACGSPLRTPDSVSTIWSILAREMISGGDSAMTSPVVRMSSPSRTRRGPAGSPLPAWPQARCAPCETTMSMASAPYEPWPRRRGTRPRRSSFLKRIMKKYRQPRSVGNADRHEVGRRLNNRAENSHQPFRQRERAMQLFRSARSQVHNHFNQECHLVTREVYKQRRSPALLEWRALIA